MSGYLNGYNKVKYYCQEPIGIDESSNNIIRCLKPATLRYFIQDDAILCNDHYVWFVSLFVKDENKRI